VAVVTVELVGIIVDDILHENIGAGRRQGACHEVLDTAGIVAAEILSGVDLRRAEPAKAEA
jgi:hypothetical protein